MGRGDRAFEVYSKIAPAYVEDISEIHRMEPYVYCQMIAGKDAVRQGEGKNSWLTGTAAWNFITASQWILGIKPDYDGLRVDPCIPAAWEGYTIRRQFRGVWYTINVTNPDHVSKGVKRITVDGKVLDGDIIPVLKDGKEHDVVVRMG